MKWFSNRVIFVLASVIASVLCQRTAIAQDCSFNLGRDTVLCAGQSLFLSAPSGALSVVWQDSSLTTVISANTTGVYWCRASFSDVGDNLVVNGDFEQGAVGFTTDLDLGIGGTWGPVSLEGTYGVSTDPFLLHSNFSSCGDHTGGGSMLVLNGSAIPNESVWCQTISVQPNTTYAFSSWLMSTTPTNPADMTFSVNGVDLGGSLLARPATCIWDQFYSLWDSGTATEATICIVNQNVTPSGNDFALDDISFSPLCSYTDSLTVTLLPEPPSVTVEGAGSICPGTSIKLTAQLLPSGWPLNDMVFLWNNAATGQQITVNEPGDYMVGVTGRCLSAQASVTVGTENCTTSLTMPNVFTPNGDGVNDTFGPIVEGVPQGFEMEIRNRWGQVLFTSTQVGNGWTGRAGGEVVPDGTYFWEVHYKERLPEGSMVPKELSGHLMLLGSR